MNKYGAKKAQRGPITFDSQKEAARYDQLVLLERAGEIRGPVSYTHLDVYKRQPQEGRTVAADWSVLPAGTEIYIGGVGWRVVEDTGAGIDGHTLDVYYDSHEAALGHGVQEAVVYARQD